MQSHQVPNAYHYNDERNNKGTDCIDIEHRGVSWVEHGA